MKQESSPKRDEIPLGLEMSFAVNPEAMNCFSNLSAAEQNKVIESVKGAHTGEEAREKVETAIRKLNEHDISGF